MLDAIELDLELFDLLGSRLVGGEDWRGVEPLTLGARDLVGCGVLFALEMTVWPGQLALAITRTRKGSATSPAFRGYPTSRLVLLVAG